MSTEEWPACCAPPRPDAGSQLRALGPRNEKRGELEPCAEAEKGAAGVAALTLRSQWPRQPPGLLEDEDRAGDVVGVVPPRPGDGVGPRNSVARRQAQGRSEPPQPLPCSSLSCQPAMPPMKLATADFTGVSIPGARSSGASRGRRQRRWRGPGEAQRGHAGCGGRRAQPGSGPHAPRGSRSLMLQGAEPRPPALQSRRRLPLHFRATERHGVGPRPSRETLSAPGAAARLQPAAGPFLPAALDSCERNRAHPASPRSRRGRCHGYRRRRVKRDNPAARAPAAAAVAQPSPAGPSARPAPDRDLLWRGRQGLSVPGGGDGGAEPGGGTGVREVSRAGPTGKAS